MFWHITDNSCINEQDNWSKRLRCDICEYLQQLQELCEESILVKIVLVHCGAAAVPATRSGSPAQLDTVKVPCITIDVHSWMEKNNPKLLILVFKSFKSSTQY